MTNVPVYMLIGHLDLYIYLSLISHSSLLPIFLLGCLVFFIDLWKLFIELFLYYICCKYFPPPCGLPFYSLSGAFDVV